MEYRSKIAEKLYDITGDSKIAQDIESHVYDFAKKEANEKNIVESITNKGFYLLYTDRLRSFWNNLQKENSLLLERLRNGTLSLEAQNEITHQDMDPEHWKALIEAKIEREKNTYENNTQGTSKEFKCSRCKKRETKYTQVQTRSADEPMTTFVTCVNCGNHWKC